MPSGMSDHARVHLAVALELSDEEPIRGAIDDGIRPPAEFRGWLELMSALEAARARSGLGGT